MISPEDAGRIAKINLVNAKDHLIENNNIPAQLENAEYDIYDITLEDFEGVSIQPNGNTYISVPYNNEYEVETIFHFNDALELIEEIKFTTIDGRVEFEADEFSYYALKYANAEVGTEEDPIESEEPNESENPKISDETETSGTKDGGDSTTPPEVPGLEEVVVKEKGMTEDKDSPEKDVDKDSNQSDNLPETGVASSTPSLVVGVLSLVSGLALMIQPKSKRNE